MIKKKLCKCHEGCLKTLQKGRSAGGENQSECK